MPPPQPLLASRIQGFVCRSCLSKLRIPRNQRPPWLSRSVVSDNGPRRTKLPNAKDSRDQHEKESKPVVRIFDQTPDGVRTEVENGPADEAFLESLQSTIRDVKEEMGQEGATEDIDDEELQDRVIARHMQNMFQGEALEGFLAKKLESQMDELNAEVDKRLENVDLEHMSEEERSKIREELYQLAKDGPHPSEQPDDQLFSSLDPLEPEFTVPTEGFPSEIQPQIRILNRALRSAKTKVEASTLDKRMARETWRAYNRCRGAFVSDPYRVPDEVWQLLWNVFAHPKSLNNNYLKLLGQDMTDAGLPLQDWQRLFYIQAKFIVGESLSAIDQWKGYEMTLGKNPDTFKDYWELGVNMHCQNHQLDTALKAAETLVQSKKDTTEFRTFIPIIQAFLSSNEAGRKQKAWALYIRLRVGLGSRMEMKDYDAVASIFFEADLPDLALGVFKDMMLTGDASAGQHDSMVLYKDGPGVKNDLDLMKVGEKELTWDDPRVLSKLPAKFNNKFFFGKWLKKLIAEGEFDASIKVFNLMHERGIRPDAKYVNGLIGAWLRTGNARYHKLAEDTAWRMIQERLECVENQETAAALTFPLRAVGWDDKPSNKSIFRHPSATIETFSVLIEDYRRRQRHDRMKDLFDALKQAKIQPSTFFMNQLMMIDSEIPQFYAWDTYTSLTRTQGVKPDFDTFAFLWYLAKKAVDPIFSNLTNKPRLAKRLQNEDVPRFMFAEMARWAPTLNKKARLPRELYDMIILSFSLAQDQPGTAIALRALQRHFNMLPNENTVRTIVIQLAGAGLKKQVRLNLKKSAVVKERVARVTKLLEALKKRRVDVLLEQGIVFEELEGDAKLEESLVLMSNLLRHVTQIRLEEGQDVAQLFAAAGNDMGVPECVS